jgi:serine/threonine-protein kinase
MRPTRAGSLRYGLSAPDIWFAGIESPHLPAAASVRGADGGDRPLKTGRAGAHCRPRKPRARGHLPCTTQPVAPLSPTPGLTPDIEDGFAASRPYEADGSADPGARFDLGDLNDATQVEENPPFGPEHDVRLGTTLGAYCLVRPLARGGMGIVYLGRHVRLGRKVAVKLPHPYVLRDDDLRRRFLSEAMAAVQIAHPGVVNVLDYGHAPDETPYLVMELLEGGSLADKMADGQLPIDMAISVASRVADTLAAAHEAGVIHRDLKPENVFLQRHRHRPDRITVKVLDFGFAKLLAGPAAGGIAPLTQQGLVVGTPCYMSPEQCLGFAPVDHRSDIYSLGCILYEMVAGRLPFSGSLGEVKLALRYRPAVPPRWHNRDLPTDLDDLIMQMLAKRPAERPHSMIELSRTLDRIRVHHTRPRRAGTAPPPPGRARTAPAG